MKTKYFVVKKGDVVHCGIKYKDYYNVGTDEKTGKETKVKVTQFVATDSSQSTYEHFDKESDAMAKADGYKFDGYWIGTTKAGKEVTSKYTKAQLQGWLKENEVKYKDSDTKEKLLEKINGNK